MSQPIRVMLADDHAAVRQGLRALFAGVPEVEVVKEVGDVETALTELAKVEPDVIVLDLSMPKTGGLRALREIRAGHLKTVVVVLTRFRDRAFVEDAIHAGASAYVLKQSSFDELRRAVVEAFNGRQYIDSRLKEALDDPPLEFRGRVSNREREVLRQTVLGQSNKDIASALNISVKTVEVHKTHGMRKLDLPDRSALVRYAALQGWLVDP